MVWMWSFSLFQNILLCCAHPSSCDDKTPTWWDAVRWRTWALWHSYVATDLLRICHKEGHLLPDVSWLWVTEMMERETSDKSRLPYKYKVKIRQCLLLLIKVLLRWHWKFFTSCFVPFRPRCKPFPFISMLSHFFLPKLPQGLQIRLPLPRSTSQQTWEGI